MSPDKPQGPKGEVLDQVEREGPITQREIVESAGIWAPDSVYTWLRELEDEGHIDSDTRNFEKYGTTRRVWFTPDADNRSGGPE